MSGLRRDQDIALMDDQNNTEADVISGSVQSGLKSVINPGLSAASEALRLGVAFTSELSCLDHGSFG
uniref:Uncharacterized protein n=1 Tax=Knipowitschia caucasica TaxID=637954 RepID=A0AAV2MGX1_KNICA